MLERNAAKKKNKKSVINTYVKVISQSLIIPLTGNEDGTNGMLLDNSLINIITGKQKEIYS